jgi:putative component of membrane protein insertase Oxa1/YidC/SpoIIIJ protein YidD
MSSSRRSRRLRRPRWLRWPKKPTRKAIDCAPDCDGCDCGDCDLPLLVLAMSGVFYLSTPPVVEGGRTVRPVLRLIRSYQRNVSARRPAVCNLSPTCSRFGYETLRDTGWRGLWSVRRRLAECKAAGQRRCTDKAPA